MGFDWEKWARERQFQNKFFSRKTGRKSPIFIDYKRLRQLRRALALVCLAAFAVVAVGGMTAAKTVLPKGLQSQLTVQPHSKLIQYSSASGMETATLEVPDSSPETADFYIGQLYKRGWKIKRDQNFSQSRMVVAERGSSRLMMDLGRDTVGKSLLCLSLEQH